MGPHGVRRDAEVEPGLLIRHPPGDREEYLALPWGEWVAIAGHTGTIRGCAEAVNTRRRERGGDRRHARDGKRRLPLGKRNHAGRGPSPDYRSLPDCGIARVPP